MDKDDKFDLPGALRSSQELSRALGRASREALGDGWSSRERSGAPGKDQELPGATVLSRELLIPAVANDKIMELGILSTMNNHTPDLYGSVCTIFIF